MKCAKWLRLLRKRSCAVSTPSANVKAIILKRKKSNNKSSNGRQILKYSEDPALAIPSNHCLPADATHNPDCGTGRSLSELQKKMQDKLYGAQFRQLNETMYKTTGRQSYQTFAEDPTLFDLYHRGFRSQVQKWPTNPLEMIIEALQGDMFGLIPLDCLDDDGKPPMLRIGDFGCGDGELGMRLRQHEVFSFDLVSKSPHIVACDMSQVPLPDKVLDVSVFCLALMGINFLDFLREARRVTKVYGCLIVAEVRSRIEEPRRFLRTFTALGFDLRHKDIRNSHFVLYVFQRMDRRVDEAKLQTLAPRLLPCLYKKR
eukprot:Rmarinus@m.7078